MIILPFPQKYNYALPASARRTRKQKRDSRQAKMLQAVPFLSVPRCGTRRSDTGCIDQYMPPGLNNKLIDDNQIKKTDCPFFPETVLDSV